MFLLIFMSYLYVLVDYEDDSEKEQTNIGFLKGSCNNELCTVHGVPLSTMLNVQWVQCILGSIQNADSLGQGTLKDHIFQCENIKTFRSALGLFCGCFIMNTQLDFPLFWQPTTGKLPLGDIQYLVLIFLLTCALGVYYFITLFI